MWNPESILFHVQLTSKVTDRQMTRLVRQPVNRLTQCSKHVETVQAIPQVLLSLHAPTHLVAGCVGSELG